MFARLGNAPVEALPLYALLAVLHGDMSGVRPNICVSVCYQLAGALEYLGFDAEVMAACATVLHRDDQETKVTDVGVWDHPPKVRANGTTNGHAVLWAHSFRRLVDPTVAQAPKLLEATHSDPNLTLPVVLPCSGGREHLLGSTPATFKGPFLLSWMLFPQWTHVFKSIVDDDDMTIALSYSALLLAHATLEVLRELNHFRSDLRQLHSQYPNFAGLLAGRQDLPQLPEEPPAAFLRLRQKLDEQGSEEAKWGPSWR